MSATILNSKQITTKIVNVLMLDSNVMIPYVDENHHNHKLIIEEINRLMNLKIKMYFCQPVLLEVINYWRLKIIFHAVEIFINQIGASDLPDNLIRGFNSAKRRFNEPNFKNKNYFFDSEVKKLREEIMNYGGINLWNALMKVMSGKITGLIDNLNDLGFEYAKFGKGIYPLKLKRTFPSWQTQLKLVESFGLASNDAAILNMASFSTIDGLISNDGDMLFVAQNGGFNKYLISVTT